MITFIRWIILCQKKVKFKLEFYRLLEHSLNYVITNKDELEDRVIKALAEIIHNAN